MFYDAFGILFLMTIATFLLFLPLVTAGLLVELTYRIKILVLVAARTFESERER